MKSDKILLFFAVMVLYLAGPSGSLAKVDLSLNVSDITFSKSESLAGEKTRIFARVFNLGDEDVYGFAIFSINGRAAGDPQVISVKVGTYDDVFIDWVFEKGNHDIGVGIVGTQPKDENADNDLVLQKDYFIDSDADRDGIGDILDNDNDNDGISNAGESLVGTDVFDADSDNDGVSDKDDVFPLDSSNWQDNDRDGLGDNNDADDDNDSLSDAQERVLGTSSFKTDSDGDLIPDKTEAKIGFLNPNRNEWKIAGGYLAAAIDAVKKETERGNAKLSYFFAVLGFLSIIFMIVRFLHKN